MVHSLFKDIWVHFLGFTSDGSQPPVTFSSRRLDNSYFVLYSYTYPHTLSYIPYT